MTTIDWTATRNEIIRQAYSILGVVPLGEDPDADQQKIAVYHLNALTKSLQANNLYLWNYEDVNIPTIASVTSYAVPNGNAIGIDEAWYMSGTTKIPLTVIDHATYSTIDDKTNSGTPCYVYFERGISSPTIYLYPVPDDVYNTYYRLARRLQDWDTAEGNAWPAWWVLPLTFSLAALLAYVFDPNKILPLEQKSKELFAACKIDNFNARDHNELRFEPR